MLEHYNCTFQKRMSLRVGINIKIFRICYSILYYTVQFIVPPIQLNITHPFWPSEMINPLKVLISSRTHVLWLQWYSLTHMDTVIRQVLLQLKYLQNIIIAHTCFFTGLKMPLSINSVLILHSHGQLFWSNVNIFYM